jgi:hypothetical protein
LDALDDVAGVFSKRGAQGLVPRGQAVEGYLKRTKIHRTSEPPNDRHELT